MEFEWKNSLCVSGDRSGGVAWWDINNGTPIYKKMVHNGGVSKVLINQDLIVTSGLKDGALTVSDIRSH